MRVQGTAELSITVRLHINVEGSLEVKERSRPTRKLPQGWWCELMGPQAKYHGGDEEIWAHVIYADAEREAKGVHIFLIQVSAGG